MPRKDRRIVQREQARQLVLEAAQSGDKTKMKAGILAARLMESIDSEFVQQGWRERATAAEAEVRELQQRVAELEKAPAPEDPDAPVKFVPDEETLRIVAEMEERDKVS